MTDSTPATGAHAAAMAYMDAQRRDMDATEAIRHARRLMQAQAAEMVTPDVEKNPHEQMGMFTRPQTQSLNTASQRDSVTHTDNTFKRDLVPQANSAERGPRQGLFP